MDAVFFKKLLDFILVIYDGFYDFAKMVIDLLSMTVSEVVHELSLFPAIQDVTGAITDFLHIGDFTFVTFMFGSGIFIYLSYVFVSWVIDLLP